MIVGLHHFAIIVSSESSLDFYKKIGFVETFRKERGYDTVVLLDCNGISLEVFIDPKHPKRASDPENMGLRHLALKVENIDETASLFDCTPIQRDWKGLKYCFTTDTDGLPIELHE